MRTLGRANALTDAANDTQFGQAGNARLQPRGEPATNSRWEVGGSAERLLAERAALIIRRCVVKETGAAETVPARAFRRDLEDVGADAARDALKRCLECAPLSRRRGLLRLLFRTRALRGHL